MAEARLSYARGLRKPGPVLFQQHAVFNRVGQIPPDEAPYAHGVVYALGTMDGRTKIGQSRNPAGRILELERETKRHGSVVLHVFVSRACANYKEAERDLLTHFQADRVAGEWFSTPWRAVVDRIESMPLLSLLPQEIEDTLDDGLAIQTVNARDLHGFLEAGRDFSTWIKERITEYGFIEGQDYVLTEVLRSPNLGSAKARAQRVKDYLLTLDTAKEFSMVERNDQGRRARRYFIECEKRLRQSRSLTTGQGEGPGLDLDALAGTIGSMVKAAVAEALTAIQPGRQAVEPLPQLMTDAEMAKQLGMSLPLLRNNRWRGRGIPYLKIGRNVRYKAEDVMAFLNNAKVVLRNGLGGGQ